MEEAKALALKIRMHLLTQKISMKNFAKLFGMSKASFSIMIARLEKGQFPRHERVKAIKKI